MTRFVHKVIMNPEDGWGKSTGSREVRLGEFFTIEEAKLAKEKRDADKDSKYCDCGNSWICSETISQDEIEKAKDLLIRAEKEEAEKQSSMKEKNLREKQRQLYENIKKNMDQ